MLVSYTEEVSLHCTAISKSLGQGKGVESEATRPYPASGMSATGEAEASVWIFACDMCSRTVDHQPTMQLPI